MKKIDGLNCILLIDDDDATNFLHELLIKRMDLDVHIQIVLNGIEALEYLTKKGRFTDASKYPQPGIVFLDINMPKMNGWEFLEVYKTLPEEQKADIIIAMLTTSLSPEDEKKSKIYREDVKEFLNKPLTKENLKDILAKYYHTN